MKHPHWSEIFYYYREVKQQKKKLEHKKLTPEMISTTQNSIANSMNLLKANLIQTLDERSVYHIIFALTSLLDEEMQRLLVQSNQNVEWLPLQKKLFNLTNAGEVFFDNLDEVLENPQFPSIVFETLYFALKKDFKGKYQNSPNRIGKYIEFLAVRIQEPRLVKKDKPSEKHLSLPKIKMRIWHYYAAAMGLSVCLYLALAIKTNIV